MSKAIWGSVAILVAIVLFIQAYFQDTESLHHSKVFGVSKVYSEPVKPDVETKSPQWWVEWAANMSVGSQLELSLDTKIESIQHILNSSSPPASAVASSIVPESTAVDTGVQNPPLSPLRKFIKVEPDDLKQFSFYVFYNKKYKFIMATIPKVSCTEFIRLFFRMQGDKQWMREPHYKKDKPLLKQLPLEEIESILNDPTWTKAVFFRDPNKRLLSAYLDKFVKNHHYGVTVFKEKKSMPYSDLVKYVTNCTGNPQCLGPKNKYTPNGLHGRTNPHWKPQVYMCNLYKFLPLFNFIGNFDHLAEHTETLMRRLGIWEEFGSNGWGGPNISMFQKNNARHATTATATTRKMYTTPDMERELRRAYWQDYSVLELLGVVKREKGSLSDHLYDSAVHDKPPIGLYNDYEYSTGSFKSRPPAVPPSFSFVDHPIIGEHWEVAEKIAGFSQYYSPPH